MHCTDDHFIGMLHLNYQEVSSEHIDLHLGAGDTEYAVRLHLVRSIPGGTDIHLDDT